MSQQEPEVIFPEEQEETMSQPSIPDSGMITDDDGEESEIDYGSDWEPTDFESSDSENGNYSFTHEELEEAYSAQKFFCPEYFVMNEIYESDHEDDVSYVYAMEE